MNRQPKDEVIEFYKKRGETPLEALGRFRREYPDYADETLSYAGRLDPMAEGVLLILVGEANKRRGEYLSRDKIYSATILIGVSTDTHDLLGVVQEIDTTQDITKPEVEEALASFRGTFRQRYPAYSSKTQGGIPLFALAKLGKVNSVDLPDHTVTISKLNIRTIRLIETSELLDYIRKNIGTVRGDFRQELILKKWGEVLTPMKHMFHIVELDIACSSGTYIRVLADDLGKKLGTPMCLLALQRIAVV